LEPWNERGLALNFSFEENLLGTAGAVKKVNDFFTDEEAFLVHYGDVVTNVDLTRMLTLHKARGSTATLLVHNRRRSNSSLTFDETFRVKAFVERPPESYWDTVDNTWVNSGIMVFSTSVFDLVPDSGPSDWPRDIFPKLISTGQLYAYCLDCYRIAVDSPERLKQLERDIAAGKMQIVRA
jgi:NDP-sugar pyrophosphorylase family protein